MSHKPTFASVTDIPCTCGMLQDAANDPRSPIAFDPQTAEFHFEAPTSKLVIYHCPFCGGAAPKSKRDLLFAVITPEDEFRLAGLLHSITTIADALTHLGPPARDDAAGVSTRSRETDDRAPTIHHHRMLLYENLSTTADVWITERADGTATWHLQGKYLRPPESTNS